MLPAWLWPLWPLLALTSGGSPQAPQPHFGDPPQPHSHDSEGLFWDHAAIWGAKEAQEQRELPPEESRRRLGLLVDLMDSDSSGGVSGEELRAWILRRHRGSREESLRIERSRLDLDGDGAVGWDELHRESFGDGEDFGGSHRRLLLRSRLRFQAADADGDRRLRGEELEAFLHPEDFQHLLHLVAQETIEDLDQNGDGLIQVDEYIADLQEGPPGSPEPPELRREREQFLRDRDRDGDGSLGPAEVQLWLSPPSSDWAGLEAQHLIHHTDRDQDGSLSREEILGRWELFVGSRATDYGQDLHRAHDEL
ncbi:reticulocalbin-3-like isoform X1 [Poecile atricapillus]|uniref:reticulocalbin-3-like isoform X1 n=1 Tax=Poecile atricapillus TaxID=48891 RepID=UPI002738F87B|nr:reticulocalbin-3-like isoform X1 [Poecile atricapillus]